MATPDDTGRLIVEVRGAISHGGCHHTLGEGRAGVLVNRWQERSKRQ
jgi:hypothetical protein